MKFMKLGSKPDCFQTDEKNTRYVATELATDFAVHVAEVKFYLHKFPLLSKSARLQKLISPPNEPKNDEVHIHDIPGGSSSFETCAKFCYGMTINLNAYNVIPVRCAAEYLEMHEKIEQGNLVYKIDVFLGSTILKSWKDSIIALQTTKSALPWSEDLKLVTRCIDAIASKASVDVSRVDWSYGYNRKKIHDENGNNNEIWPDGVRSRTVPNDWWVEDLCDLEVDLYKRVIVAIRNKGIVTNEVIGEALIAYAYRKLPGSKCVMKPNDLLKFGTILDAIVWLMPSEKGIVPCSFLLKLLKTAMLVKSGEAVKTELVKRIGQQLEEASFTDLLIRATDGGATKFDVLLVQKMVQEFKTRYQNVEIDEVGGPGILSEASELMVAKLIDGYLAEIAKDPDLPLSIFVATVEMVSSFPRPKHDGLYRAIDTYLKEHRGLSKSERKRVCGLMECKKLSAEACRHAVQNERLPLRVVVQVLFLEQVRSSTSSGTTTPDLPKGIKDLSRGLSTSSGPTPNADEDWDGVASAAELRALRAEVAALRLGNSSLNRQSSAVSKVKGLISSRKIFSRIRSSKGGTENLSRSDSSESLGSTNHDEAKCTPTRRGRHSVS